MGRIWGGRDKTTEVKRRCRGLGGYGMCSYNKQLCVKRPNHPDLPLGKSFGRCTKALCAEFDVLCCRRIKSEEKIELLEKQCFPPQGRHSAGSQRVPFSSEPHVWVPVGEWALLKWKTEGTCKSSPKLQALGGGSAKCNRAQSQPGFTGKYDWAPPPPFAPKPTWRLLA